MCQYTKCTVYFLYHRLSSASQFVHRGNTKMFPYVFWNCAYLSSVPLAIIEQMPIMNTHKFGPVCTVRPRTICVIGTCFIDSKIASGVIIKRCWIQTSCPRLRYGVSILYRGAGKPEAWWPLMASSLGIGLIRPIGSPRKRFLPSASFGNQTTPTKILRTKDHKRYFKNIFFF